MDTLDLRKWKGFRERGCLSPLIDEIVIDSRLVTSKNSLFVALEGKFQDGHNYVESALRKGAKFALVKKGYASSLQAQSISDKEVRLIEVDSPLSSFQEIAAAYRNQKKCQLIAITGAYGKTMVKDLLLDILRREKRCVASPESFNSQIGVPLSLLQVRDADEIAIIEAAVSRPGEMDNLIPLLEPSAVIFTPLGEKHLRSMGGEARMVEEYSQLLRARSLRDFVLLPSTLKQELIHHPIHCPLYFWDEDDGKTPFVKELSTQEFARQEFLFQYPESPPLYTSLLGGYHYTKNLLNMAVKAAFLLGAKKESITLALENYAVEPTRTEIWKSPEGPTFINEPYGQNPLSFEKAARFLEEMNPKKSKVIFFGGIKTSNELEEGSFRAIAKTFSRLHPKTIITYGNFPFFHFMEEVRLHSPETTLSHEKNFKEALRTFRKEASQEDIVLIKGSKKEPLETLFQEFNDSISVNQCLINLAAVQSNLEVLRQKLPLNTRIMVMIKAMAYGTDDIRMAHFLQQVGVDILGVSYVDEGVALKRSGVSQAIFAIHAAPFEAAKVVKWGLEVGLSSEEMIVALEKESAKRETKTKVHLHIDTGMSRLGARKEEALHLLQKINGSPWLILEGIMTHFPSADDPKEDAFTLSQVQILSDIIKEAKAIGIEIPWRHAANSAGAIRFQFPDYNMVRIGLAAYGLYGSDSIKESLPLSLAVSLVTRIVGINCCLEGETISYGRRYRVEKKEQKIAVLPLGYFDGLHRNYSGKSTVIVRGKKAPMVGTICMDFMMIDITDIEDAALGDRVLIFGEDEKGNYVAPEELAERGGSIVHELITCLGPRIQRVFVYEEREKIRPL